MAEEMPPWFLQEGFAPAIDPDFDAWRIRTHRVELPTVEQPSGRVVCEVRGKPEIRLVVHLSPETGDLIGLEVLDRALVDRGQDREPRPISARLLREIPFGEIERSARHSLRWELASRFHSDHPAVVASLDAGGHQLRESLAKDPRPGRRGRADAVYASLAAAYVHRLGSGREVAELAEEMNYSASQVRNMLAEARRRGLLTHPAPGKSGGQLTHKALQLLAVSEPDSEV